MEQESLIRALTLLLPKVEHQCFFFARQCSFAMYPLKDIADPETWNQFASLYYYYLPKDRKGSKKRSYSGYYPTAISAHKEL